MTLGQMERNKKIRAEEEFEETFFKGKGHKGKDKKANKYQVVEEHMKDPSPVKPPQEYYPDRPVPYA